MKTVIANLKLYLPNRQFLMAYLYFSIIICFSIGIVVDQKDKKELVVGIFMNLPFFAGFLTSLLQIEVFSKPFSFCLPGHKRYAKEMLVIISIIASFVLMCIAAILIYSNQWSFKVISLFFMNLIFFFLGAELILISKSALAFIWVIMFMPTFYNRPYEILGGLIIQHPFIIISIGSLCCILIWFKLNFSGIHRKLCAVPQMPFAGLWNKERLEKYNQFKLASKKGKIRGEIKPWVERFFLNKMNSYRYYGMGRYIWGNLYKTFGPSISLFNPLSILITFAFLFIFCYSNARFAAPFGLFMFVVMITAFTQMPVYSTLLISDGRRERYYSALFVSITCSFYMIFLFSIIIIITNILQPFMPDLKYSSHTLTFNAISYSFLLLPIIVVPLVLSFYLFFYKRKALMFVGIAVIYALFVAFIFVMEKFFNIRVPEMPSLIITPTVVISTIILMWSVFLAVLRRVCFQRSLV